MALSEERLAYRHPVYDVTMKIPGGAVAVGGIDALLSWGLRNALWMFPMATSCCGIELMAAAAARVDLDRMGSILRGTPRQADVMVVAGTITVKMAPRVRKLWDQMPEPKWCIAMGSCAISGDFYRNIYSVVPGIDTVVPVDLYIPGCPPNPEALMEGLMRLQKIVKARREKKAVAEEPRPEVSRMDLFQGTMKRYTDPSRDPSITQQQTEAARRPGDEAGQEPPELPVLPKAFTPAQPAQDWPELLRARFGVDAPPKDAPPLLGKDKLVEAASAARENGFTIFSYVVASHWPAPAPKDGAEKAPDELELAYGFRRPTPGAPLASLRIRVKVDEPVPSLCSVFAGADWQEREQADLFGIRFEGHPDLRRILLPEAWKGHPLRRDYPIDAPCLPWR